MRYCYCVILLFITLSVFAQKQNQHVRNGNRLYKTGEFEKALVEYQKAVEGNVSGPVLNYNLGNAYFRNGQFGVAANAFNKTLSEDNKPALRQKLFYNKGVALSMGKKLEESIEAYKNALKLDPSDKDARINLQKALMELEKKQPPEQESKPEKNEKQQEKMGIDEKKQEPKPAANLTKKQVEQLLKALQQREQQVQMKMQQNRNRSAGKQEKDW